jgi:CBS domain-containing protein
VGILSEADVLSERIVPDPRAHLQPLQEAAPQWHRLVDDVMTPDPVTVQEKDDVRWVAELLADKGWKSLPVLCGRRLVGVISRSDIVRVLGTPDAEIARRITEDFTHMGRIEWQVEASHGVVVVRGTSPGREARIAKAIAETAPGVRRVTVELPTEGQSLDEPGARGESLQLRNLRRWPRDSG